MNHRKSFWIAAFAVLCVTAAAYSDVSSGEFVWDDIGQLRDQPWLLQDGAWRNLFERNFTGSANYFRPLSAALLTAQVRTFGLDPAPMHVVSLILHLLNTLLVGCLARQVFQRGPRRVWIVALPMLLYGLHPALVEPVAWISAQMELALTFFMLLTVLANVSLTRPGARALAVGSAFAFAAGCKESAAVLPVVLVVLDWARLDRIPAAGTLTQMRELLRRQWLTYAAMVGAGLIYLGLRAHLLGYLLNMRLTAPLPWFARIQEVCDLYLVYWRMLVWPMVGLGPVHAGDEAQFVAVGAQSLGLDAAAIALVLYGCIAGFRRRPAGVLVLVVSVLLLPFLHVVPVIFDESLYHDRYVMAPLALMLALLPNALAPVTLNSSGPRRGALALAACFWLILAVVNVRLNLPLWGNETALWQWAVRLQPDSVSARENLFASYVTKGDVRAAPFARALTTESAPCSTCLLSVANYAMHGRDLDLAAVALARLQAHEDLGRDAGLRAAYWVARGSLCELTADVAGAESAYRAAIASKPRDAVAQTQLALLLARRGATDEARRVEQAALQLLDADERAEQQRAFERALDASAAPAH